MWSQTAKPAEQASPTIMLSQAMALALLSTLSVYRFRTTQLTICCHVACVVVNDCISRWNICLGQTCWSDMSSMAQVMMKQKNNRNLDARQSMLVESAYYQCNPPQHSALKRKKRPVVQDWMRHLIFVQLGKDDVRKVRPILLICILHHASTMVGINTCCLCPAAVIRCLQICLVVLTGLWTGLNRSSSSSCLTGHQHCIYICCLT